MMRPILFLDIDGVLNSGEWMSDGHVWGATPRSLCPDLCERLERVIAATDCDIVLSSSWRHQVKPELMEHWLRRRGTPSARVIDSTPEWVTHGGGLVVGAHDARGHEIQSWLDAHPERAGSAFAIVDDSDDMVHLTPRLVLTSWSRGIEDEHVAQLVAMLGEPPAALEPAHSITSAVDSRAVSAGERARRPVKQRGK